MKQINRRFILVWLILIVTITSTFPAVANDKLEAESLVKDTEIAFSDLLADPTMQWFRDHVNDAEAIVIVPQLLKAGFIFGASGGTGVAFVRDRGAGTWRGPAFYTVGSVTWGLQIGGEVAQVAMLVMTDSGMRSLLSTKLQLGGDVSIAAGPVGVGAQAATVDILEFTRTKGVYGGLTLEGAVITPRDDLNLAFYGRTVDPLDILVRHSVTNPAANHLTDAISRAASASRS
jgi:SH3 domain-containing YSC84-like protein 1